MLLAPKEVGAILGLHPKTVIRLFISGEIPGFRLGKRFWRISRHALDEYINSGGKKAA